MGDRWRGFDEAIRELSAAYEASYRCVGRGPLFCCEACAARCREAEAAYERAKRAAFPWAYGDSEKKEG